MCPSIEISEQTIDVLEELQEDIRDETGRTIPKRLLLKRIIQNGYVSDEATLELFEDDPDS